MHYDKPIKHDSLLQTPEVGTRAAGARQPKCGNAVFLHPLPGRCGPHRVARRLHRRRGRQRSWVRVVIGAFLTVQNQYMK